MCSAQNLLLHLLWLCLGWNHGARSNKHAASALLEVLREEEPNIYLHSMEHCPSATAALGVWGCQLPEGVDAVVRDKVRTRLQIVIGVAFNMTLSFEQALAKLESKGRNQGHLFRALSHAGAELGLSSAIAQLMRPTTKLALRMSAASDAPKKSCKRKLDVSLSLAGLVGGGSTKKLKRSQQHARGGSAAQADEQAGAASRFPSSCASADDDGEKLQARGHWLQNVLGARCLHVSVLPPAGVAPAIALQNLKVRLSFLRIVCFTQPLTLCVAGWYGRNDAQV